MVRSVTLAAKALLVWALSLPVFAGTGCDAECSSYLEQGFVPLDEPGIAVLMMFGMAGLVIMRRIQARD